jgi:hypothetical protein
MCSSDPCGLNPSAGVHGTHHTAVAHRYFAALMNMLKASHQTTAVV